MAKRIGRPTKEPTTEGRVSLGLRVTPQAKRRLDEAARKSGRSQSQEAEFRIEQSFRDEDQIVATWGTLEIHGIAALLASVMYDVISTVRETDPNARLLNHEVAFRQAKYEVMARLDSLDPARLAQSQALDAMIQRNLAGNGGPLGQYEGKDPADTVSPQIDKLKVKTPEDSVRTPEQQRAVGGNK